VAQRLLAWRVNFYNDITVQVKGEPLIAASGIKSQANTRSADIGDGRIFGKADETITVDVSIVAKYGWMMTSTMSGGSGDWTGTPNQLRSGVTVTSVAVIYKQGDVLPQWDS